jgi:hypothetical protein
VPSRFILKRRTGYFGLRVLTMSRPASRYTTTSARGLTRQLWRVRARLEDSETGELMDLRSNELAATIQEALARADSGELPQLPLDASALTRYESVPGAGGWFDLWQSSGGLLEEPLARTRSPELARRVVDVLNRLDPELHVPSDGTVKAGWF